MDDVVSAKKITQHIRKVMKVVDGDFSEFPVTVHVGPMAGCNHDCVWCSDIDYRKKYAGYIDADKFRPILKELAEGGTSSIVWIGSGEPTFHPRFPDLVDYAAEYGLAQGIITNGARFPVEKASKFSWMRVSLDAGTAETHEKLHRANDFEKIMDNLRRVCSEHPNCTVGVSYLVNFENSRELAPLVERLDDYGVTYLQVHKVVSTARYVSVPADVTTAFKTKKLKIFEGATEGVGGNAGLPCWASSLNTVVAPTGDVFLCCRLSNTGRDEEAHLGSLWGAANFRELWNSEKRREVVQRFLKPETTAACPTCWMTRFNVEIAQTIGDPLKRSSLLFV